MKNIFYIFYIVTLLLFNVAVNGQQCITTKNLVINTGISTSGTNLATTGQIDPYWQLVNISPPSINGSGGINIPNAYTILSGTPAGYPNWCNIPGVVSLNVIPSNVFSINNTNSKQPWRFRRKFSISAPGGNITIAGQYVADDKSTLKIYDSFGTLIFTDNQSGWNTIKNFSTTFNAISGCYFLEIELTNVGSGLMGFSVKANITSSTSIVANPTAICCNNSIVTGQKWIDNNCNGILDAGDTPAAGWVFNLMSGSSVIQTATTDSNGEFTFNNVSNGNYTVSEVNQMGYTASFPTSGSQTVSITSGNSVAIVKPFLNCKSKLPNCCKNTLSMVTPVPVPPSYPYIDGTYAVELYNITAPSSAPITEIRVETTSFEWLDGPEDCKQCQIKTSNLGSLFGGVSIGGVMSGPTLQPYGSGATSSANNSEVVFAFSIPKTFAVGDFIKLTYVLPPDKELSCCHTKAKVCRKISWKDTNCGYCEVYDCSVIDLKPKSTLAPGFPMPSLQMLYLNTRGIFALGHAKGY